MMNLRTVLPALLASAALLVPLAASAQSYGTRTGEIASVQGNIVTLRDGTTVYLHPGMGMNPAGANLEPGMRIRVRGTFENDGAVDADSLALQGRDFAGSYDPGARYYGNGWYDGNGSFHRY